MMRSHTEGSKRDTMNLLVIVAIVVLWILLMKVILPRLGVPT